MKQKFIQTLLLILLPTLFTACGSDNNNDPADDISGLTVNTDLKNNEVSAKGGSFFLQIKTDGKWTASSKDSWCTINNKKETEMPLLSVQYPLMMGMNAILLLL